MYTTIYRKHVDLCTFLLTTFYTYAKSHATGMRDAHNAAANVSVHPNVYIRRPLNNRPPNKLDYFL